MSILAIIVGDFQSQSNFTTFDHGEEKKHLPGTSEIIFVLLYITLSIGVMNILIGLCVANIKDIMMQKEDFKLGQMIINNYNTEVTYTWNDG